MFMAPSYGGDCTKWLIVQLPFLSLGTTAFVQKIAKDTIQF